MRKTFGYFALYVMLIILIAAWGTALINRGYIDVILTSVCILYFLWNILIGKYDWRRVALDVPGLRIFEQVAKFHGPLAKSIDTGCGVVDTLKSRSVTPWKYLGRWTIYHGDNGVVVFHDNAAGLLSKKGWYYSI